MDPLVTEIWTNFFQAAEHHRERIGGAPVCLISMPVAHIDADSVRLAMAGPVAVFWPPGLSKEEQLAILRQALDCARTA